MRRGSRGTRSFNRASPASSRNNSVSDYAEKKRLQRERAAQIRKERLANKGEAEARASERKRNMEMLNSTRRGRGAMGFKNNEFASSLSSGGADKDRAAVLRAEKSVEDETIGAADASSSVPFLGALKDWSVLSILSI